MTPDHDCARTSRTYLLGISSCKVCEWSVWDDIRVRLYVWIRSHLNGEARAVRNYYRDTGERRVFMWRYGWEWTHGDPKAFKAARRAWEREAKDSIYRQEQR